MANKAFKYKNTFKKNWTRDLMGTKTRLITTELLKQIFSDPKSDQPTAKLTAKLSKHRSKCAESTRLKMWEIDQRADYVILYMISNMIIDRFSYNKLLDILEFLQGIVNIVFVSDQFNI